MDYIPLSPTGLFLINSFFTELTLNKQTSSKLEANRQTTLREKKISQEK